MDGHLFEHHLISLATELPNLTSLCVRDEASITQNGLIKLVSIGKRLKTIAFHDTKCLHLNEQVFKALLNEVQGNGSERFLFLHTKVSTFDVPETLIDSTKKYLNIKTQYIS